MRLRVIRAFNDRYTDEFFDIGTELTVSDDRGSELVKADVVEIIPEVTSKAKKSNKKGASQ